MSRFRYRRKKTRSQKFLSHLALIVPLALVSLSTLTFIHLMGFSLGPDLVQPEGRIFTEGVTIQLNRTSPAFAALEDSLMLEADLSRTSETEFSLLSSEPEVVEFLASGVDSGFTLAKRIMKDNKREQSLFAQARFARERAGHVLVETTANAFKRFAESQSAPQVKTTTRVISLRELKINREDLVRELLMPIANADISPSNPKRMALAPRGNGDNRLGGLAPRHPQAKHQAREVGPAGLGPVAFHNVEEENQAPPLQQIVISGPIEFSGGLALTNPNDRVVVYREQEGQRLEAGSVWLRDGRYEIFVEVADGSLVAELRNPYGEALGRGQFDLVELPSTKVVQNRVEKIRIKIGPLPQGIVGRVSTTSGSQVAAAAVAGAPVEFRDLPLQTLTSPDGKFKEEAFIEGSTAIMRVAPKGTWKTQTFVASGTEAYVEVLPARALNNLIDTASKGMSFNADDKGIIVGRVTNEGKPVYGAAVDILTTNDSANPIYFNADLEPDPSLRATSANGLYAYYPVSPGAHAVQATLENGLRSDPEIFPTEPKTVSRADIDVGFTRKAKIKVFDAFRTDWPLSARITNPGFSRVIEVPRTGEGTLRYSIGPGLMLLDVDSGFNYERIRVSASRDRKYMYFPMIQRTWMNKMRGELRVNSDPGTGAVVGFVQGPHSYKVSFERQSQSVRSKVVYFNNRGEITSREYGVSGGGFILFNVPEGFQQIIVQPSGTQKFYNATVLVESKVTNVVNHLIR